MRKRVRDLGSVGRCSPQRRQCCRRYAVIVLGLPVGVDGGQPRSIRSTRCELSEFLEARAQLKNCKYLVLVNQALKQKPRKRRRQALQLQCTLAQPFGLPYLVADVA